MLRRMAADFSAILLLLCSLAFRARAAAIRNDIVLQFSLRLDIDTSMRDFGAEQGDVDRVLDRAEHYIAEIFKRKSLKDNLVVVAHLLPRTWGSALLPLSESRGQSTLDAWLQRLQQSKVADGKDSAQGPLVVFRVVYADKLSGQLGIAYTSAMCSDGYRYGIANYYQIWESATKSPPTTYDERARMLAYVVSHEMGHMFGLLHDGEAAASDSSGFEENCDGASRDAIMATAKNIDKVTLSEAFSRCSKQAAKWLYEQGRLNCMARLPAPPAQVMARSEI